MNGGCDTCSNGDGIVCLLNMMVVLIVMGRGERCDGDNKNNEIMMMMSQIE